MSAGYHSACRTVLDGSPVMLVWGGLGPPPAADIRGGHDLDAFVSRVQARVTVPIGRLEYMYLGSMQWKRGGCR